MVLGWEFDAVRGEETELAMAGLRYVVRTHVWTCSHGLKLLLLVVQMFEFNDIITQLHNGLCVMKSYNDNTTDKMANDDGHQFEYIQIQRHTIQTGNLQNRATYDQ